MDVAVEPDTGFLRRIAVLVIRDGNDPDVPPLVALATSLERYQSRILRLIRGEDLAQSIMPVEAVELDIHGHRFSIRISGISIDENTANRGGDQQPAAT